jgi:hypothetical protein
VHLPAPSRMWPVERLSEVAPKALGAFADNKGMEIQFKPGTDARMQEAYAKVRADAAEAERHVEAILIRLGATCQDVQAVRTAFEPLRQVGQEPVKPREEIPVPLGWHIPKSSLLWSSRCPKLRP